STRMSLFFIIPPPPTSSLFPYTTLFRSSQVEQHHYYLGSAALMAQQGLQPSAAQKNQFEQLAEQGKTVIYVARDQDIIGVIAIRSEEHTSELQSRENIVCRLLLEKKKNT